MLIPLRDVRLLGPIAAKKWKHENDGDVDAEEWIVGNLHFLEVSILAEEGQDPQEAQRALRQRVLDADLPLEKDQEPKTTTALRHLASRA